MTKNRIMTTKELALYIKMNEKTVLKMAQDGRLPGVKIGSHWRFHLDSIDACLQNNIIKSDDKDLDIIINTAPNTIPISRLIGKNLINLDLKGKNSSEVLAELSQIAVYSKLTSSEEKLINDLKQREKMLSTAIGNGVAIPHPRHPSEELFKSANIVIGRSVKGIDFKAPDNKKVNIFFMTCAPTEFVHLRMLAMISKLLHRSGVVRELLNAENKDRIIKILLEFERQNIFPLNKN